MKVSIITTAYNSASTIRDTLSSVAAQSYSDIEHIIIDGASGDDTLEIIRQYPHVRKMVSEKDRGIYNAMNKGLGLASGDIIGILNSDDFYLHDSVIEKVVRQFESSGCDAVYADLQYVDQLDTRKIVRRWKSGVFSHRKFLWGWMPPHPTFFVRREVYARYGLFKEDLRSSADYEIMLRFLYRHQISCSYLPETIVSMRTGGVSNASIRNRLRANREDRMAWRMNDLHPYFFTLVLKPLLKIKQFI